MESILPEGARISDEAVGAMVDASSEFLAFITSEASAMTARMERGSTLHPRQLVTALNGLGYV